MLDFLFTQSIKLPSYETRYPVGIILVKSKGEADKSFQFFAGKFLSLINRYGQATFEHLYSTAFTSAPAAAGKLHSVGKKYILQGCTALNLNTFPKRL